jgi:hypothetical protein
VATLNSAAALFGFTASLWEKQLVGFFRRDNER